MQVTSRLWILGNSVSIRRATRTFERRRNRGFSTPAITAHVVGTTSSTKAIARNAVHSDGTALETRKSVIVIVTTSSRPRPKLANRPVATHVDRNRRRVWDTRDRIAEVSVPDEVVGVPSARPLPLLEWSLVMSHSYHEVSVDASASACM